MGAQAAEQIIAGVVLSERLAVTMYGAIHRAQWSGQRTLRGLVVDPKMLAEESFRNALTDPNAISTVTGLDHVAIVPTIAVESGGPDVVVVTRGVGRYVTVQDLISAARANRKEGGKLSLPVAAAIGKAVVEALAVAHKSKVVHGAVHPRSVLVDEDGAVRLGDFVVGRALTTAVAKGADSSLWRGLAGYLAPELVVGEDPTPASDVFACGAMLFTMLSGEVPPGTLHVTPAVERLVQRALDTDLVRRYKNAADLLENLLEAFEDDRWEIAGSGEVIKTAGLSRSDSNIDDATEDLLASLGTSSSSVQVTPIRPSMDIRAEAVAARHTKTPSGANRLDALLADLDHKDPEHTAVDERPFKRDPISELIQMDPRKKEAIVQVKPRVPSLDDPDDETPIPPPARDSENDITGGTGRLPRDSRDERAAMNALAGLEGSNRLSTAAEQAEAAASKLEAAAARAEKATVRVETNSGAAARAKSRSVAIVDPIADLDVPPPRIKSRLGGIIGMVIVLGLVGGAIYLIRENQKSVGDEDQRVKDEKKRLQEEEDKRRAEQQRLLTQAQIDPGTIVVNSSPVQGGVWLKLGRTPFTTPFNLPSAPRGAKSLEIRVELEGHQPLDTQITNVHWSGDRAKRSAKIVVPLKPLAKDDKGKVIEVKLKPSPAEPPAAPAGDPSMGPVTVESTPTNAAVWLYIGATPDVRFESLVAGRDYELRVLANEYHPGVITVRAEEWREPGGDPNLSIDAAKKKAVIEKSVELIPDATDKKKKGN